MELTKRIVIAVIFIPIIVLVVYLGGLYLAGFLGLIVFFQSYELKKMFESKDIRLSFYPTLLSILLFGAVIYYDLVVVLFATVGVFVVLLARDVFTNRIEGAISRITAGVFTVFYTSVLMAHIFLIRNLENGILLILSLIVTIWLTDTIAFFFGMLFGKHRGVVKVSPRKSVEGFIAGLVGAVVISIVIGRIIGFHSSAVVGLIIAAGIFGQIGDLFESLLKRDCGVKDSSALIPGHGGVLDRFDSLQIAAPVFYHIVIFFMR